jgi:hypothetical protein
MLASTLSSLTPLAAAVVYGLADQVVATFDVAEGDENVG